MSKSSAAKASKNPTAANLSAWSKGPPLARATSHVDGKAPITSRTPPGASSSSSLESTAATREVKEAEEKRRQEEEAEKGRIHKEEEGKEQERLKKEEEKQLQKGAEEREVQRIKEEKHKWREEEETMAKLIAEERAKNVAAPPLSALATARAISDINAVTYPEGVKGPRPDLNANVKGGKFRYDLKFLLQFMPICKEKPATLPPLETFGLASVYPSPLVRTRGGSTLDGKGSGRVPTSSQASIGHGLAPSTVGKGMGNFATLGASKLVSQDRFSASARAAFVDGAADIQFTPPMGMTRTAIQSNPGVKPKRTRTKRNKPNDAGPGPSVMQLRSSPEFVQRFPPPTSPIAAVAPPQTPPANPSPLALTPSLTIVNPKQASLIPADRFPGADMNLDEFCTAYRLTDRVRKRLDENGYSGTHTFQYVEWKDLREAGLKTGEIAQLKHAISKWSIPHGDGQG